MIRRSGSVSRPPAKLERPVYISKKIAPHRPCRRRLAAGFPMMIAVRCHGLSCFVMAASSFAFPVIPTGATRWAALSRNFFGTARRIGSGAARGGLEVSGNVMIGSREPPFCISLHPRRHSDRSDPEGSRSGGIPSPDSDACCKGPAGIPPRAPPGRDDGKGERPVGMASEGGCGRKNVLIMFFTAGVNPRFRPTPIPSTDSLAARGVGSDPGGDMLGRR